MRAREQDSAPWRRAAHVATVCAMPIYRDAFDSRVVFDATLDEVWAYIDDQAAQQDLDDRIQRLDVVEGSWGEAGSRVVATATLPDGAVHTWEQTLVEVARPDYYVTRTRFPDGVTEATHRFRGLDGGVEWHHSIAVTTRQVTWLEYLALMLSRRQRRREGRRDHAADAHVFAEALVTLRER